MTMPNFLLIGTQKAGTSSLYSYLKQHPQIFMSTPKEPLFFMTSGMENATSETVNDLDAYLDLFAGVTNEDAIGEASALYLACPWAPTLIKEVIPDVKMIAILRNPVDRAWSHYLRHAANHYPMFSSDIEKAIEEVHTFRRAGQCWEFGYVSMGMYYQQLMRYYSLFSQEQLLVLLYDDMLQNMDETLRSIFSFLMVDNTFRPDTSRRTNVTRVSRSTKFDDVMNSQGMLKKILKRIMPRAFRTYAGNQLRNMNTRKPTLHPETRARLTEIFSDEVAGLQGLLGRDLSGWLS